MKEGICSDKKILASADIGNSSTELALAVIDAQTCVAEEWFSSVVDTTGTKGSVENTEGIRQALEIITTASGISVSEIQSLLINEATPVIGDFAMETVTETVVTDSSLIGHNPDTPGGHGIGRGITVDFTALHDALAGDDLNEYSGEEWIPVIPEDWAFNDVAKAINDLVSKGVRINALILQKDDGVLISNRLVKSVPIVDEVKMIDRIPMGALSVVEVAGKGQCIRKLSNPYGIAELFDLDPDETRSATSIARALIGLRSAVVIKTPDASVVERIIPSGEIQIIGEHSTSLVDVKAGAKAIRDTVDKYNNIGDVRGTPGTNVGGMIERVRLSMSQLTGESLENVTMNDLFAVDTTVAQAVKGGVAREIFDEHAVGIAVMIKTQHNQMSLIAGQLQKDLSIPVRVGGVEAEMAVEGALTTPGSDRPVCIVDIGAGSTDACYSDKKVHSRSVHLAGAGNMVTMMINSECNLDNWALAEEVKKWPLASVESFYSIRNEDDSVVFLEEPISSELYGKTVVVKEDEMIPLPVKLSVEKVRSIRRRAKKEVIINNIIRCLRKLSPTDSLSFFEHVILVGGSSLDFEIGNMITEALTYQGITSGVANVRGCEGPRNAVATGLILSEGVRYA